MMRFYLEDITIDKNEALFTQKNWLLTKTQACFLALEHKHTQWQPAAATSQQCICFRIHFTAKKDEEKRRWFFILKERKKEKSGKCLTIEWHHSLSWPSFEFTVATPCIPGSSQSLYCISSSPDENKVSERLRPDPSNGGEIHHKLIRVLHGKPCPKHLMLHLKKPPSVAPVICNQPMIAWAGFNTTVLAVVVFLLSGANEVLFCHPVLSLSIKVSHSWCRFLTWLCGLSIHFPPHFLFEGSAVSLNRRATVSWKETHTNTHSQTGWNVHNF